MSDSASAINGTSKDLCQAALKVYRDLFLGLSEADPDIGFGAAYESGVRWLEARARASEWTVSEPTHRTVEILFASTRHLSPKEIGDWIYIFPRTFLSTIDRRQSPYVPSQARRSIDNAEAIERAKRRPASPPQSRLWAVILAGGEGSRLRPLTRLIHDDDRPKQFARLDGRNSMLVQTLRRAAQVAPPERTIVVTQRSHEQFIAEAALDPRILVFAQPSGRGTAAAILWPMAWISAHDPEASIIVFPSDHFIGDEETLAAHLSSAVDCVDDRHIILFGAQASSPETGYGWIRIGAPAGSGSEDLFQVQSFTEKPDFKMAEACLARGDLWNTFLFTATARALFSAVRRTLPEMAATFGALSYVSDGGSAISSAVYEAVSSADISKDILAAIGDELLVSRLPPIGWSDWGTPERILKTIAPREHVSELDLPAMVGLMGF